MKIIFKNNIPVIRSKKICKIIAFFFGVPIGGVMLFPFIVVRDEDILNNQDYIRHESIHIYQCIETLILGIYIIGALQYLYARFILKKNKIEAYYFMSHEQEAHQNDQNKEYLNKRKWLSYYKYLLPKNKRRMDYIDGKRTIY
ncbi:MAG: hypothetical protein KBD12_02070 [Candidatus Pacebacteria bacterium]|nr:hypothetical protein [Candidatus Paceibacterota bacterium]